MRRLAFYLVLGLIGISLLWLPLLSGPASGTAGSSAGSPGGGFMLWATVLASSGYLAILGLHALVHRAGRRTHRGRSAEAPGRAQGPAVEDLRQGPSQGPEQDPEHAPEQDSLKGTESEPADTEPPRPGTPGTAAGNTGAGDGGRGGPAAGTPGAGAYPKGKTRPGLGGSEGEGSP